MVEWLKASNCQIVAMESTGSYWKPLVNILELEGLDSMVVNAQHMKSIPGRKSDVNDAQWIAKLLRHGLLQASFIPDRQQREYREITRYRNSRIEERAREKNRLQKMVEGANIKLSNHVSKITGVSAISLLELAMSSEELTIEKIKKVRHGSCKSTAEEFLDALTGVITPLQRELFAQVLYHVLSGKQFVDLGAEYYTQFNREKKINSHLKQLKKLGWEPERPAEDTQVA